MSYKSIKQWLYQGGRPNWLARILNRGWAIVHQIGILPNYLVTLEVTGRKSGKIVSFPLVLTVLNGQRYLVSMLGEEANWVKNIKATAGLATLRHGRREHVRLVLVEVDQRAPILKAYLQRAPGARPHLPIDMSAPVAEFEPIAAQYPVYRLDVVA